MANQDFTTTKKRVRIFVYEFDSYFSGDPSYEDSVTSSLKEEGGFLLILASFMVILSLILLGMDLALSPLIGLKKLISPSAPQTVTTRESPGRTSTILGNRNFTRQQNSDRRESYGPPFRESSRESRQRHYNTPASRETSFINSLNLRPQEYWL